MSHYSGEEDLKSTEKLKTAHRCYQPIQMLLSTFMGYLLSQVAYNLLVAFSIPNTFTDEQYSGSGHGWIHSFRVKVHI